jgi:hypothetical protein
MDDQVLEWLLASAEPWTRYRTRVELLDLPENDPQVQSARAEMLVHPQVQSLVGAVAGWPGYPLQRHNDTRHPIHALGVLADLGVRASDAGLAVGIHAVMAHQSTQGAFQTQMKIATAFGGTGEEQWAWINCDAPVLLHSLLALGTPPNARLQTAADHLVRLVKENGWRCSSAPELGRFKGPGRASDPCPIANVYALKALAGLASASEDNGPLDQSMLKAIYNGVEMLLQHWENRLEKKYYLFGVGSSFQKLKYPFIWYDILHVVDVLSRFPIARQDERFVEMWETILVQVGEAGRFTPGSAYLAWKDWSFADKKNPSPWLTFLILRIEKRIGTV